MTLVWRTRGPAYHSREDCSGIADGQAEARRQGYPTYNPVRVPLSQVQSNESPPRPCMICWPRERGWNDWLRVMLVTEQHSGASDGSPFELKFLEDVLMRVEHLEPGWVEVQHQVEKLSGGVLRPDFVIDPPGQAPIAIEIDGYRKSAQSSPDDQGKRNRRDAELERLGYRVQHFSNKQVTNEAEWCRRRVGELLAGAGAPVPPRIDPALAERRRQPEPVSVAPSFTPSPPMGSPHAQRRKWWVAGGLAVAAIAVVWGVFASGAGEQPDDGFAPSSGECTDAAPIKGNISESGEKIFHAPGWEFYSRTSAEECFATPADAEAAGYRASERQ